MTNIFTIIQLVLAVALIVSILLQNRGGGLSGVFGGSESTNAYRTKRGMEKTIFYLTIIFSVLFFGVSIANILLQA
ncbi:preprotein translocase subunit SecG [Candidatus Falkowbacteria bacterium]|jgi:preprotein translocase subunit SecG|nr:preprotein translocase subunit SecG [Candidatus Falkowbacteria bacterium]MBT5503722.1 preprotein translocase subunit SecG [Candidatus Falkowbacteria bacterium]MBT6573798.1 preprotein translocase subunit SecG [Candidatus Falkowbacteria bacterium]MBT7348774.1 preprotein translocase subunit SecG [Candidatus Falkowbacteria bacterium]MBT7500564.1 preprotein translocase subunit SecG [Candidatus Falkowbacteria bacterium]